MDKINKSTQSWVYDPYLIVVFRYEVTLAHQLRRWQAGGQWVFSCFPFFKCSFFLQPLWLFVYWIDNFRMVLEAVASTFICLSFCHIRLWSYWNYCVASQCTAFYLRKHERLLINKIKLIQFFSLTIYCRPMCMLRFLYCFNLYLESN